jgi:hypothetical protein
MLMRPGGHGVNVSVMVLMTIRALALVRQVLREIDLRSNLRARIPRHRLQFTEPNHGSAN